MHRCRSRRIRAHERHSMPIQDFHPTSPNGDNGNPAMSDFQTEGKLNGRDQKGHPAAKSFHGAVKRLDLVAASPWGSLRSETGRAWGVYVKRPTYIGLNSTPPPPPSVRRAPGLSPSFPRTPSWLP